jgi:flagellar biosynthetic protein FliR
MFFFTVSIAGEIIGVSSGLASAQLYNPTMGAQSNVIEQFHVMLASLLFLALDGHHIFLQGLAESFQLVPVSDVAVHSKAFSSLALIIKDVFAMGLKIAAPVMIAILLTNVAMGLVGRAVPQMNVLMTSLQITIVIGVGVVIISMPLFIDEVGILMKVMANQFFVAMRVL